MSFDAKSFLATLTESPGVYKMLGEQDEVLYVGKAKNLKRRVSSYFQKLQISPRIAMMVSKIARVEISVTRTEAEALLLENNLIKTLKPYYNILFRDDKSYPYIVLSGDEFPRIGYHRGTFAKGARYFGPFPNAYAARESVNLLQRLFQLRTCENAVFNNRSRPCLLHQIKRCTAPCVGFVDKEIYTQDVRMTTQFLEGRHNDIIADLTHKMQHMSETMDYEQAMIYRDQIRNLQAVLNKQYIASSRDSNVDILVAVEQHGSVCVNLAMIRGGRHLGDRPQLPQNVAGGLSPADALLEFIEQHYSVHPAPTRIVLTEPLLDEVRAVLEDTIDQRIVVSLPRYNEEKAWIEMAQKGAIVALATHHSQSRRVQEQLEALTQVLNLSETPHRIECFDISHTMGEATVASCVVFVDSEMKRSEYRRFNITGIEPGDDYAAMRQVLTRRYEKIVSGEGIRPDLILIDGGKGQVGVAYQVLSELGLAAIPMVGVAKGVERKAGEEDLIWPDVPPIRPPMHLGVDHPALHLIQIIRDEAHRFAITGHRAKRSKTRIGSRLEDISGIGPTRRKKLIEAFGGLDGVKKATIEDLCRVDGISRKVAEQIYNALHS